MDDRSHVERRRRVEALYHDAAQMPVSERADFLRLACDDDVSMREEVEALLAAAGEAASSLEDRPTIGVAAAWVPTDAAEAALPARIGRYELISPLGIGGMGAVYKARDTQLNRPVAIKFLSTNLVDESARRRFQQEAKMASALNHPHILTVHEAGEIEGRQYLVTEFVDGGTLEDWSRAERRSWRQIVDLLIGVADGLATAHGSGILHRDIKPGNVLVSKSGYAKLADFGLAKLEEDGPLHAVTRTAQTRPGMILGTIPYMSPEQAAGKPLDARSDIFSFGVVLYELLTGDRPFGGRSSLETLQAILDAPHKPLPDDLPVPLRLAVEKALEKDPSHRYQSMRELVVDLRREARRTQTVAAPRPAAAGSRRWLWAAAVMVVTAVATIAIMRGAGWLEFSSAPATNPLADARFTRLTDFPGDELDASLSADGRFVAFVADRDGPFDIWLTQVGSGEFRNITQGKDTQLPATIRSAGFSGDGSQLWIGGDPLKRLQIMPLIGGTPRPFLGDKVISVSWSPDGARLVYHTQEARDPTFVADRDGSNARQIYINPIDGGHNHFPVWSPDGQWIYFVSGIPAINEMDLWRVPSRGGTAERLTTHSNQVLSPAPIDNDHVVYVAPDAGGSGPWLWSLDVSRRTTQRVSLGIERYLSVTASADGRRLVTTVANPSAHLSSVPILPRIATDRDVKPFTLPSVNAHSPRFARDSLYYVSTAGAEIGLWRFRDGQAQQIWKASDGGPIDPPAISPDGRLIAFALFRNGRHRLHRLSADGAELQPLTDAIDVRGTASWSPDGQWIAVGGSDSAGAGLFKIPLDGGMPMRVVKGTAIDPVWSPDGTWIAYAGANVSVWSPLLGVRPDGTPVDLPAIRVRRDGHRIRFLPNGTGMIYMEGAQVSQDFWLMDLATKRLQQLTRLGGGGAMTSFDITPDGTQIVFERTRNNSDIVLIDLAARPALR
jgi:Tol biopolymer transport system component/tRNA A-37 threonylcarbamoyl transferase component Bud32